MAELENLVLQMMDEVHEAGFQDLASLAGTLEEVLAEHGQDLSERQADALQLTADILHSMGRSFALGG